MIQIFLVMRPPPEKNVSGFITFLSQLLGFATLNKWNVFLCGDVNVDMHTVSKRSSHLSWLLQSNGF